jgi:hypothetical protein
MAIPTVLAVGTEGISMFKRLIAFALAAALCGASASVLAQSRGGGHSGGGGGHSSGGGGWQGGGGNWHGGGGNWHGSGGNWHGGGGNWHGGHGGYWHNGRWYGNVSFALGAPWFYWGWPYYYPYAYDPYYYPAASYPVYSYYPAPNAVYLDSPAGQSQSYPQAAPYPQQSQRPATVNEYYYCPDSGYYPSVQNCPKGWTRVIPNSPPPQ